MKLRFALLLLLAVIATISVAACSGNQAQDPVRSISAVNSPLNADTLNLDNSSSGVQILTGELSQPLAFEWDGTGLVVTNNGSSVYDLKLTKGDKTFSYGIVEKDMKTSALTLPIEEGQNIISISYSEKPYIEINNHIIHSDGFNEDRMVLVDDINGYIDNEVLFGFVKGTADSERYRVIREHNLFLTGINTGIGMHKGRIDDGRSPYKVVEELKKESSVRFPEINGIMKAQWAWPNDHVWNPLWPDDYRWSMQRIQADKAWDIYKDGVEGGNVDGTVNNVVLCVADTGVHPHVDFALKGWRYWAALNYSKNFDMPGTPPLDNYGHGTSVTGIAGGTGNNGFGIAGVSWSPFILSVKCLSDGGYGSWEVIGNSIHYIGEVSQVFPQFKYVANYSLGGGMSDAWCQEAATFTNAFPNTLLLAAAGNWGSYMDFWPASYAEFYSVAASSNQQVDVGGVLMDKEVYQECPYGWGSNWSPKVWVCAPGSSLVTTTNIPWTVMYGSPDANCPESCPGWYCQFFGGTSAATPHVSGLAMLVWNKHMDWTKAQVMQKIYDTCDPMSIPPEKVGMLGGGRINCYRALTE